MLMTDQNDFDMSVVQFSELEDRYGRDSAYAILRTLEQFEGVYEQQVTNFSFEERLQNVLQLMKDGMRYQTRH